jgi:hypothetical protein
MKAYIVKKNVLVHDSPPHPVQPRTRGFMATSKCIHGHVHVGTRSHARTVGGDTWLRPHAHKYVVTRTWRHPRGLVVKCKWIHGFGHGDKRPSACGYTTTLHVETWLRTLRYIAKCTYCRYTATSTWMRGLCTRKHS